MKSLYVFQLTFFLIINSPGQTRECGIKTVIQAQEAMGGESLINKISNLELSGYGFRNLQEQSERFEGPYIPTTFSFSEVLDMKELLVSLRLKDQLFQSEIRYIADQRGVGVKSGQEILAWPADQIIQDELFLNPLLIFSHALKSKSLICQSDTLIHGVINKRVHFDHNNFPVTISLNSSSHKITCIKIRKPYTDNYLHVWGDGKRVIFYSFWDLLDNGVPYPMQRDSYINGNLWEAILVRQSRTNAPLLSDSIRLPETITIQSVNKRHVFDDWVTKLNEKKTEIIKNIWLLPGYCTSTILKQDDSIVIIEAPHSSLYSQMIIDESKKLFPNLPIKYVISTSDAWLHCGGVRAAVNESKLIALESNQLVIDRIIAANFITYPDSWQSKGARQPNVKRYIKSKTQLGSGINRVELIPFNTEAGERMMMVYFPEHKLLYASDLYQPGNWQKHYTLEVIQAVQREGLEVDTIYGMHAEPIKYSEVLEQMKPFIK